MSTMCSCAHDHIRSCNSACETPTAAKLCQQRDALISTMSDVPRYVTLDILRWCDVCVCLLI
ncbi:hypothetical protein BaRGS_00039947, partial [Batillaria attramentaria]